MRRFLLLATICGLAFAAGSTPVRAQESYYTPWAIKAGGFFPIDRDMRRATSNAWFLLGGDYTFRRAATHDLVGTVEWTRGSDADIVSLQGIWKRHVANGLRGWYYGAGPAVYWVSGDGVDTTKFGIPLMVGLNLNANWFGEAKYHWLFGDVAHDVSGDGFTVAIGYRF